jgi:hypothetical protein
MEALVDFSSIPRMLGLKPEAKTRAPPKTPLNQDFGPL